MVRGSIKSKIVGAFIVFTSLGLLTYVVLDKKEPLPYPQAKPVVLHHSVAIPTPSHVAPISQPVQQYQSIPKVAVNVRPVVQKSLVAHKKRHAAIPRPSPVAHVYWVQVASYHALQNARLMRRRLLLLGYPSRIDLAHAHGTSWYRLNAGPFATQHEAYKAQRAVRRKWKLKTQIRVTNG